MASDLTLPGAGEPSQLPPDHALGSARAQLSRLPSVDALLNEPALRSLTESLGSTWVKRAAQHTLAELRRQLAAPASSPLDIDITAASLVQRISAYAHALAAPRLRAVINLSGTVIHTNLGRALLADEAIDAVSQAMRGYAALEFDLDGGSRGDRDSIVEALLCELTGAEAATVVNNNAAAVVLGLAALAARREVLISRGELIEIGGAFRMPDIMKTAGCKLVEVGTTNRTHARDFESALSEHQGRVGLVVKAHWSNYAITGFTAAVDDTTLAACAHAHGVPYMVDLGAGALVDLSRWGLPREPMPREVLAAGADVVTFSGDKLLGGPQAGLMVGSAATIARIKKHPLKRALRCSKLTLAALEATLRIYSSAHRLDERLPVLALLTRDADTIAAQAARVSAAFAAFAGAAFNAQVLPCASQIGSGSLPVDRLPSAAVVLTPTARKATGRLLDALAKRLRALPTPVVGRLHEGALWLDCRTLLPADEPLLLQQLGAAC